MTLPAAGRSVSPSPFGPTQQRSQWSATYRRIFNTFPQYEFIEKKDSTRRYDLPPPEPIYSEIAKEHSSPPPQIRIASAPPVIHHQRSYSAGSSSSLSPQSILRSSADSSPRSRKKVSICDETHDSNLPQELAIRKALNREDVEDFLVALAKKEFPGGGHVEVTSQPPRDACFDSLMKMTAEDKTIYVSLKQLFSVADKREKLSSPTREQTVSSTPEIVKKPVTRLDSNATTTSFASTGTSLLAELKDVKGLLNLDDKSLPRREDHSETIKPKSWTTSRTWKPVDELPPKEDFSKKPVDPSQPHLIAIVRNKVETGQVLDWPDLFVLKTFHCTTVQPLEETMFRRYLSDVEIQDLRIQLNQEYTAYERILESVRVSPGAYTSLAHSICLADAYWFHARIIKDARDRENLYRRALNQYSSLMKRAEGALPPDDISLLHVAEKTATLLAESKNFDPDLVMRAALLVDRAERALDIRPEATARRRARLLKARLAEINEHCQILV